MILSGLIHVVMFVVIALADLFGLGGDRWEPTTLTYKIRCLYSAARRRPCP